MGFTKGSVSFRRFAVVGKSPATIDQDIIDKLNGEQADGDLPQEELNYHWGGGHHIDDRNIGFAENVFNDAVILAMRVVTNRVPADQKKAWMTQEKDAVAALNPSGFISKNQKKDVRDTINKMCEEAIRSGKFRKVRLHPVMWDVPGRMMYASVSGKSYEMLADLVERTLGFGLAMQTSGVVAAAAAERMGLRRDFEDARPTRFAVSVAGPEQVPEYPWVAKGVEPKDFVGNEFLAWLWHLSEKLSGVVQTSAGEIAVLIDRVLEMECGYGISGKDVLKGDGPGRSPEAAKALATGKVPRGLGLVCDIARSQYAMKLSGESLAVSACVIPEIEEADTPRVVAEERVDLIRGLSKGIDALVSEFVKVRLDRDKWASVCRGINSIATA